MKHWSGAEIESLGRLRAGFLDGSAGASDYWESTHMLQLYDRTFGVRIGWKWRAVLSELRELGWQCPGETLVDFGCGPGVASRSVVSDLHWQDLAPRRVTFVDRSALAREYATRRLIEERDFSEERVTASHGCGGAHLEGALAVVSHVLSELPDRVLQEWVAAISGARALIWVDAGTRDVSRRLVERVREPLVSAGWSVVAPCTHLGSCPLRSAELDRHWCHHFAQVPAEVHQNAAWRELSSALGIDLRVLPYSFLVMEAPGADGGATPRVGLSRVVGKPREFKGYLKVLSCSGAGSGDWMLQKRDAPELFREIVRGRGPLVYRWQVDGNRIVPQRP